jgi:hypothetical protein
MTSEIPTPRKERNALIINGGKEGRVIPTYSESFTGVVIVKLMFRTDVKISTSIKRANVTRGGLNRS